MIGIIGGYGEIGLEIVKMLIKDKQLKLKVGGRNPKKLSADQKASLSKVTLVKIDLRVEQEIMQFIDGCSIIINCSGAPEELCRKLAERVIPRGRHYLDIMQHQGIRQLIPNPADTICFHNAGSIPGLSGCLPRYLCQSFQSVSGIQFYYGVLGAFTYSAAQDYLNGLVKSDSKAMMTWQDGELIPYLKQDNSFRLPLTMEEVRIFPYFNDEALQIAREFRLRKGGWYMALQGACTTRLLERAREAYRTDPDNTIAKLCIASQVDCQGRQKYAGFVIEAKGIGKDKEVTKCLICKAKTPARLTAAAVVMTLYGILNGGIAAGIYDLSNYSDAKSIQQMIGMVQGDISIRVSEMSLQESTGFNEGEI